MFGEKSRKGDNVNERVSQMLDYNLLPEVKRTSKYMVVQGGSYNNDKGIYTWVLTLPGKPVIIGG
jgi:hypothetical protein